MHTWVQCVAQHLPQVNFSNRPSPQLSLSLVQLVPQGLCSPVPPHPSRHSATEQIEIFTQGTAPQAMGHASILFLEWKRGSIGSGAF